MIGSLRSLSARCDDIAFQPHRASRPILDEVLLFEADVNAVTDDDVI